MEEQLREAQEETMRQVEFVQTEARAQLEESQRMSEKEIQAMQVKLKEIKLESK